MPLLTDTPHMGDDQDQVTNGSRHELEGEREAKKKRPTPNNSDFSAAAAAQLKEQTMSPRGGE